MEWKTLALEDQTIIDTARQKSGLLLSDLSFTNLWMWQEERNYSWTQVDNHLCIRYQDKGEAIYLFPLSQKFSIDILQTLFSEKNQLKMRAIPEEALPYIQALPFPYTLKEEAEREDYIFLFEDLVHLSGNKFQAKRNLIYQFEQAYDFSYTSITADLIPQLLELLDTWLQRHGNAPLFQPEYKAVKRGLTDYFSLPLQGGALLVQGKVVGFSFAEKIDPTTWLIHAEKADINYKGVYQMLSHQLLLHLPRTKYINKEETLGLTGLTHAKDSYHPIKIFKKFFLSAVSSTSKDKSPLQPPPR